MLHPLLHLVATQPQLLADHAEAYAELVTSQVGSVSAGWKRRAIHGAVGLCALGVGLVLAGVAVMLWAITPAAQMQAPWALLAAPALPLVVALWCLVAAQTRPASEGFSALRQQVQADLAMLKTVSAP